MTMLGLDGDFPDWKAQALAEGLALEELGFTRRQIAPRAQVLAIRAQGVG